MLVQAPEQCSRGHFWVLLAPNRHVLFKYTDRHDGVATGQLLGDYEGYLVADAHSVYNHLYRDEAITEVACWAHCRRYFFKALESEPELAKAALAPIAALFRQERAIATAPRKKKQATRLKKSKPIVERFFAWCNHHRDTVLDESPISKALGYALNQREALSRFLEYGLSLIHI